MPFLVSVCSGCHREIPETGGLNHRSLFSHNSGGRKCEIRVPGRSGSGEGSLPHLQRATFSLGPHLTGRGRRRGRTGDSLIPSRGPTLMPPSNPITLGIRISAEGWRVQAFSPQHLCSSAPAISPSPSWGPQHPHCRQGQGTWSGPGLRGS